MKIENPIPTPSNKQKFMAQAKGFDADYIAGFDDGEFIKHEIDEDLVRVDELANLPELSKLGIY